MRGKCLGQNAEELKKEWFSVHAIFRRVRARKVGVKTLSLNV